MMPLDTPPPPPPPSAIAENDPVRKKRLAEVAPALVFAFMRAGLPGIWGIAIARQESDFKVKCVNTSAADAKRGYSWGLCQMSLQTAKDSLGYRGDGPGLTDPNINATLAACFCKQLRSGHHTTELADIAALYNSGRMLANAPFSTRSVYVPRVLAFAEIYSDLARTISATFVAPAPKEP